MEETASAGSVRKEIYRFLDIQEEDTERHRELRALLVKYGNTQNEDLRKELEQLHRKYNNKLVTDANSLIIDLKKLDLEDFKKNFRPKHWQALQAIVLKLIKYVNDK